MWVAEVQARAAEVLASRQDCVIQAETGSGKTLAFLLPAMAQVVPEQPVPAPVPLFPILLWPATALRLPCWQGSCTSTLRNNHSSIGSRQSQFQVWGCGLRCTAAPWGSFPLV